MNFFELTSTPYKDTYKFKKIVTDYISDTTDLQPFYEHTPNIDGIKNAIQAKKITAAQRANTATHLLEQYKPIADKHKVVESIHAIQQENTFTICTAHQPNIFTGYWYVIYKICHTIALANHLQQVLPAYKFVPVFYMGSEDADLDELGSIYLHNTKYTWHTNQTGAVGRMVVDDALLDIKNTIHTQIAHLPNAAQLQTHLQEAYTKGTTIAEATFVFIHKVFAHYGLVVLIPDNAAWKTPLIPVFKKEIIENKAQPLVQETSEKLEALGYKAQAYARPINLFYLHEQKRVLIEKVLGKYKIGDQLLEEKTIIELVEQYPERFSPNVILRGVLQESILPNIGFIGGGGELAYWLQLKNVFELYNVNYPVLLLRNSFTILQEKQWQLLQKAGLTEKDLFTDILQLKNNIAKRIHGNMLELHNEEAIINDAYKKIKEKALAFSPSLGIHVDALQVKHINRIEQLQKKLLKTARIKNDAENNALDKVFDSIYPSGGLQERKDNFLTLYATLGNALIEALITHSEPLAKQLKTIILK
jgi:bacillithiol synthase